VRLDLLEEPFNAPVFIDSEDSLGKNVVCPERNGVDDGSIEDLERKHSGQ